LSEENKASAAPQFRDDGLIVTEMKNSWIVNINHAMRSEQFKNPLLRHTTGNPAGAMQ